MANRRVTRGLPKVRPTPVQLSTLLKLDPLALDAAGAFDTVLNLDTPLFVDPVLLRDVPIPELKGSYEKLKRHFGQVLTVLQASKKPGDIFWKKAQRMLVFPEVEGLCIGYSGGGTSGRGSGSTIAKETIEIASEILEAGRRDPEIFEIMGLFQSNFGPDRISDMTAGIIIEELKAYSRRIYQATNAQQSAPHLQWIDSLPKNPFNNKAIILAPWDILDELPIALEPGTYFKESVDLGDEVRERLNSMIRQAWAAELSKQQIRSYMIQNPELLDEAIRTYRTASATSYDFKTDNRGWLRWYRNGVRISVDFPLHLSLTPNASLEEVVSVVAVICDHFKKLVEDNAAWRMMYDSNGKPHHERHAQLLFFVVAEAYCRASNIDLSPEVNAGSGAVDFKLSKGFQSKVLVEVKLTTNQKLVRGLEAQLPQYAKAEEAHRSIYLVIEVGGPEKRLKRLKELAKALPGTGPIKVIWVDATPKESASNL